MMKRILLLSLALGLSFSAMAQSTHDGSIYSRFGIGELQPFFSSRAQAMGGTGLALGANSAITLYNPASLSEQIVMRAVGGFQFERVVSTDAASNENSLSSGNIGGVLMGVPILFGRLGAGVSLTPYSRVGYRVESERPLEAGDLVDDGATYRSIFEGNGGLERVSAGVGYRINPRVSIGVRGDFIFGILESVQRTRFADASLLDARVSESTRLRGFSGTLGVRANTRNLLSEGDLFALAATISTPTSLSGDRTLMSGESVEPDTLGPVVSGSVDLPLGLGLGAAYHPNERVSVAADFLYEPWSSFESDFSLPGYTPASTDYSQSLNGVDDRVRVSAGVEFFPGANDLLAGFFKRTAYRLGAFFERSYASPDPTQTIRNAGVTGGLSFPTLIPGTRVDINLEAGTRGTASGMLVRDRYIRLGVHLNFAERWFARRRLG